MSGMLHAADAAPRQRKIPCGAAIAFAIIAMYALAAIFAPLLAPHGQADIVGSEPFAPWSAEFPLGTDQLGRDMLSRMIYGARNSVGIAMAATVLAFALGGGLGMLAALARGWTDELLSRLSEVVMAVPQLVFALLLLSVLGTSIASLIGIIAVLDATRVFRLARAVALNVVVSDYVEAAHLRKESVAWITLREILPNILPILIAEFGLRFCFVFLTIAALSFLGLGIQPPAADWGSMVRDTATLISYGDITPLLPAGAIAVLTVAVNMAADWLLHRVSGLADHG